MKWLEFVRVTTAEACPETKKIEVAFLSKLRVSCVALLLVVCCPKPSHSSIVVRTVALKEPSQISSKKHIPRNQSEREEKRRLYLTLQ